MNSTRTCLILPLIALQDRSPAVRLRLSLGSFAFARRYLRNSYLSLFLQVLKCFTSLGAHSSIKYLNSDSKSESFLIRRFSDQRLLGTSPKHIVATPRPSSLLRSLGIHHILLNFPLGNLKTTIICLQLTTYYSMHIFEKTLIIYTFPSITFFPERPPDC